MKYISKKSVIATTYLIMYLFEMRGRGGGGGSSMGLFFTVVILSSYLQKADQDDLSADTEAGLMNLIELR
jgi:hypothetical protein